MGTKKRTCEAEIEELGLRRSQRQKRPQKYHKTVKDLDDSNYCTTKAQHTAYIVKDKERSKTDG